MGRNKKVKKESPGESPRGSPGVLADPQNESKTSLLETLQVRNHLFFDSGDSFLTHFGGVGPGPSETPSETLPETLF